MKRLTIAIDGYSACGKSTLAKDLADQLDYTFIDSGAMYRGVTLFAIQNNLIQNDQVLEMDLIKRLNEIQIQFEKNVTSNKRHLMLNGVDVEFEIRQPRVAAHVSKVATIKEVREKLVEQQRNLGADGGVVMDGRDIGSVVFPNADLKLFVTADSKVRAKRRLLELESKGIASSFEEVLQNLEERDEMDRTRTESPLVQTADAVVVDTSNHTRESQLNYVLQLINERFENN
ncbi:MAG TPA: (d)CMP kinase [Taishania sp.]|nr:(d)CMP kinase [Taishania sp.]